MVKIANSLLTANAIKEGIKKLVKKLPSTFTKSKQSSKTVHSVSKDSLEINESLKPSKIPSIPSSPKPKPSQSVSNQSNRSLSLEKKPEKPSKKPNETLKLKFKNFSGTFNDFRSLLDSKVNALGNYKTINFKPNKVVVTFTNKETLDRYLAFYNKLTYNDQVLRVSVLDYISTVKSDYKVLNLYGIPDNYDLESLTKGLKRRIDIEFKLHKEENCHKLSFKSVADCVKANSILNNCRIPLVKDKKEQLVKVTTSMELFGESSRNSSRVFVRNIPFNTTYEDLLSFFKEYDRGVKVHIPSKSKGFAFVNFSSLEKSKKLINELNGKLFKKRKIQLSLSLPKQLYSTSHSTLNHENTDDKGEELDEDTENDVTENNVEDNNEEINNKNIKDTIFVRNLDYECTENELMEYFSKFGDVESCNICRNEDNSSKGTAFVKFKNKDQVKNIIENEKLSEIRDKDLNNKKPVLGLGYTLRGRRLKLDLALPKDEAKLLKEQKVEDDNKKIKEEKNLHLLMVGVPNDDSSQFNKLSQDQQESIKQSIASKLEKIKQNNAYVNSKRICIKNLPSNVKSNELRTVIYKHLKSSLSNKEYLNLKKLKNRGIVDVKLLKGDSYTKDNQGVKVKKNKPFAFVQFVDHNIAMKTLQFLSNNSTIYPQKTLQCEFTVDTIKTPIQTKFKTTSLERKKKRTYSRGKRQREKRRQLKLNQ